MDSKELEGKVSLVTGASRGLGRAIAIKLASMGTRVAVNYSASDERAKSVIEEIERNGGEAEASACLCCDARHLAAGHLVIGPVFEIEDIPAPVAPAHPAEEDADRTIPLARHRRNQIGKHDRLFLEADHDSSPADRRQEGNLPHPLEAALPVDIFQIANRQRPVADFSNGRVARDQQSP